MRNLGGGGHGCNDLDDGFSMRRRWLHQALFGGFTFAAIALMLNGLLLLGGDALKHRRGLIALPELGWLRAFLIGLAQALALIPGFSRSGATLVGFIFLVFMYCVL